METLTLLNQLSFWVFGGLMILGALGVVFHRSIVYSALSLLVTFLSIAAFFVMLNAPFIAAAQILVYGVGLTIVLIFGIMLTGDKPIQDPVGQEPSPVRWILPAVVALGFIGLTSWAIFYPNFSLTQTRGLFVTQVETQVQTLAGYQAILADGGIGHIGELLFTRYLIPFEAASILLLLAMMGAIILSKKALPEEEGLPPLTESTASYTDGVSIPQLGTGQSTASAPEKEMIGVH